MSSRGNVCGRGWCKVAVSGLPNLVRSFTAATASGPVLLRRPRAVSSFILTYENLSISELSADVRRGELERDVRVHNGFTEVFGCVWLYDMYVDPIAFFAWHPLFALPSPSTTMHRNEQSTSTTTSRRHRSTFIDPCDERVAALSTPFHATEEDS